MTLLILGVLLWSFAHFFKRIAPGARASMGNRGAGLVALTLLVSIILAHNHPSGDPTPSQADIDITKQIIQALKPIDITVHDHVIIGKHGHYSFKSHGLI